MEQNNFIFTIGHGNRPLEELVEAVLSYDIDYLIDVRSTPYSRYCPQFARERVRDAINSTGRTQYAYLGDQLGGYPNEPEYQTNGKVDYEKYSQSERFQNGIARLKKGCCELGLRLCIMCAESDPTNCHRTRLISNELEKIGVPVRHIVFLPESSVETAEEKDAECDLEVDTELESVKNEKQRGNENSEDNDEGEDNLDRVKEPTKSESVNNKLNKEDSSEDVQLSGKKEIRTVLLTHGQVISGIVRKLKTSGCVPPEINSDDGLFAEY